VYATLLTATPAAALGRVMALVSITLEGTFPISNYLTGLLTQVHGGDLAFLIGGGVLVGAAAAAATRPAIRHLRAAGPTAPGSTHAESLPEAESSAL
jgi:hypothetical protein